MPDSTRTPPSIVPMVVPPVRPTRVLSQLQGESPALAAMTDFRRDGPAFVAPERRIDDALRDMIARGVSALVVVELERVLGLVTASDITGERPIGFLRSLLCRVRPCRRENIHVSDIMTPWADLEPLDFDWIACRTVADVAEVMIRACATHLLVVGGSADGAGRVALGLFSRTRMERQLDRALPNPC